MAEKMFQVENFHGVVLRKYGKLTIAQGAQESLSVEASEELLDGIAPTVEDGKLILSLKRKSWWDWILDGFRVGFDKQKIEYHLVVKDLERLEIPGAALVRGSNLDLPRLEVKLGGAGEIVLDNLRTRELSINLNGAGSIKLAGKTDAQEVKLTGVGSYNGRRLESETAKVTVSGAGSATVWVHSELSASVQGVGSIGYYGSPSVEKNITGIGSVNHLGSEPKKIEEE
jgi:hypothetical protein